MRISVWVWLPVLGLGAVGWAMAQPAWAASASQASPVVAAEADDKPTAGKGEEEICDPEKKVKKKKQHFRGLLGKNNRKIRREGDKVYLWSGVDPTTGEATWYDFTGSPVPPEKLQFGIGKDRIPSIDDPLFVEPNDPRLLTLPRSPYRPEEKIKTNDDIPVFGVVRGSEARAYPTGLLDRHELVNDIVGGKPITVGW